MEFQKNNKLEYLFIIHLKFVYSRHLIQFPEIYLEQNYYFMTTFESYKFARI